jgi:sRNA-binding regulator protein Hfq
MSTRPNWSQVRQNQQRQAQAKPQTKFQQQQQQPKKANDYGGFDPLVDKQRCKIKLGDGEVIEGLITATSKFWYLVNVDGQVVIVNKAWVMSITPIQNPNTNNPTSEASTEVSTNASKTK